MAETKIKESPNAEPKSRMDKNTKTKNSNDRIRTLHFGHTFRSNGFRQNVLDVGFGQEPNDKMPNLKRTNSRSPNSKRPNQDRIKKITLFANAQIRLKYMTRLV